MQEGKTDKMHKPTWPISPLNSGPGHTTCLRSSYSHIEEASMPSPSPQPPTLRNRRQHTHADKGIQIQLL